MRRLYQNDELQNRRRLKIGNARGLMMLLALLLSPFCGSDLAGVGTLTSSCGAGMAQTQGLMQLRGHASKYGGAAGQARSMLRDIVVGNGRSTDAVQGHALHAAMATLPERDNAAKCQLCHAEASIGQATRTSGLWVQFLCEQCHANVINGDILQMSTDESVETLALAGKCTKCRTKATYGRRSSLPQRCAQHKQAQDIFRILGASCIAEGCPKARLFGSRGGPALFCAAHRRADDVDVKNKRCQHAQCSRQASYGDAATRVKIACAQHRLEWHVDLKHERKRCAAPEGCSKLGIFKRRLVTPATDAVCMYVYTNTHTHTRTHTHTHTHAHKSAS